MRCSVKLRIYYNHRWHLIILFWMTLLSVSFLGYLGWGYGEVAASSSEEPQAVNYVMRKYYLTNRIFNGANADGSDGNGADTCAQGYHFASLWELLDLSNMKYNEAFGQSNDDSGYGPPSSIAGWARTGYTLNSSGTPGQGNCNAWDNSDSEHSGTYVYLPSDWSSGGDFHVWKVGIAQCDLAGPVWCVEDDIRFHVYLPLIDQ
jgi:hypothetical protein